MDLLPNGGYPQKLSRAQQAQFCIGYYQQRNKYIQDATAKKAEKEKKNESNEEAA